MAAAGRSDSGRARADAEAAIDPAALFQALEHINERPEPWSRYTADALWTSPDISEMMLRFHLDGDVDVASRQTDFIGASVDWIGATFELRPGQRVIDLGCGPGLYTNGLARTGAQVTGIDFSSRSIDHARAEAEREGLAVELVLGDYFAYEAATPFDLALLIMCDYCALSPGQRSRLLGQVRRLLVPEGALLFDVYSLAAFETWDEQVAYGPDLMDGFWSVEPYFGFLSSFRYEPERLVLEQYVIVERHRLSRYFNWFQHYDVDALTSELEAGGFVVERVLGDVAGAEYEASAPEFAVIARVTDRPSGVARGEPGG